MSQLPKYQKPPLTEVVFGVNFEKMETFKAPHFGIFWASVRQDYPRCEQVIPADFLTHSKRTVPLPRIWLISKDERSIIQLQDSCFIYNWRKTDIKDEYPHYEAIYPIFREKLDIFSEFVKSEELGVLKKISYELTYVNQIELNQQPDFNAEIDNIFKYKWNSKAYSFLQPPSNIGWQAIFDIPGNLGKLIVKTQIAQRQTDGKNLVIFELSAKSINAMDSLEKIDAWFASARGWIVNGFSDLTTESAQKNIWERIS